MGATMYNRDIETLENQACKWWPEEINKLEANFSIIPLLLKTQDKFINLLNLAQPDKIEKLFQLIKAADFPGNLFLKHLIVLTDFGSEQLQRINREFSLCFPENKFSYVVEGSTFEYSFTKLPCSGTLTNKKMNIDNKGIQKYFPVDKFYEDLIILLLFGGNALDGRVASIFKKCEVGNLLGHKEELEKFVKQRYIFVSKIMSGAKANDLGNAAQKVVMDKLNEKLKGYSILSNGHIPGVTQNEGRTLTTFDVVVGKDDHYVAIEISFQVTTNSTIERKSGQARERFNAIHQSGDYVAYIIDGAGNFQRKSALTTICAWSDCTVAFTDAEFEILIEFIQEKIG